jgi:CheY-like chemotaxis protein
MPSESSKLLVDVLRKIPILKGLSPSQVKKILSLCAHKPFKPGAHICRSNSPSDEMYILLSGELIVVTIEGIRVATILPVTTVGEMGVITGLPRSATVEVSKPSNIFVVKKRSFDSMMRDDSDMRATVYKNIIDVLADKLNNDNVRLRDYQMEKTKFETRVQAIEKALKEQQMRTQLAMGLAAERSDQTTDEIAMHIEEHMRDLVTQILVVDDEEEFRKLATEALPSHRVIEAASGKEALALVREQKIDLVITDIRMPEMDGFALLERLRASYPKLPVLAVSGYLEASEVHGYEFDGFIDKPVSLDHLRDLVEATVAHFQKSNKE